MNPRIAVALQIQKTELSEAAIRDHARMIVALYDRAGVGRLPQYHFTVQEIADMLRQGRDNFEYLNGRYLGVRVVGDGLELDGFIKVHGMAALDDAVAASEGRPLVRI